VKGVCPLHGDRTRGLAPFVGAGEAGSKADPATVGGSTPLAGSSPAIFHHNRPGFFARELRQ